MTKGWLSFLTLCLAGTAILYQVEVDKNNNWITSQSITLKASISDSFKFVTTADYMSKWFPFVSSVREGDGKELGIGKEYYATYQLPVIGDFSVPYRIVEFVDQKKVAVESDSFLKPRIQFNFKKISEVECHMEVLVSFQRRSCLFQYTIGPLMHFLTSQQLQRSLFLLRMVLPY